MKKYAVIDLGSNTVRLSVYEVNDDNTFNLLFSEKDMAGLVNYIDKKVLSADGIRRACESLNGFKRILGFFPVDALYVFATASLRNIRNTVEAVDTIFNETGIRVDVLSGEEEGRLSYKGAAYSAGISDGVMFDIGGGSTELVICRGGRALKSKSMNIGSLGLFRANVKNVLPKRYEIDNIIRQSESVIAAEVTPEYAAETVCGVGGTARAALKLARQGLGIPADREHMSMDELETLKDLIINRSQSSRDLILQTCPDRIHTVTPGIIWMHSLCKALKCHEIFVSSYGVREGYLCQILN